MIYQYFFQPPLHAANKKRYHPRADNGIQFAVDFFFIHLRLRFKWYSFHN